MIRSVRGGVDPPAGALAVRVVASAQAADLVQAVAVAAELGAVCSAAGLPFAICLAAFTTEFMVTVAVPAMETGARPVVLPEAAAVI